MSSFLKMSRGSIERSSITKVAKTADISATKVIKFHKEQEDCDGLVQMISPMSSVTNLVDLCITDHTVTTSQTKTTPQTDLQLRRKHNQQPLTKHSLLHSLGSSNHNWRSIDFGSPSPSYVMSLQRKANALPKYSDNGIRKHTHNNSVD